MRTNNEPAPPAEQFGGFEQGEAYEPHTGRWSRQIAHQFLDWIGIGSRERWLDIGCGTGAIIQAVVETLSLIHI
jgi:methylase of polypeptide subunit release factors